MKPKDDIQNAHDTLISALAIMDEQKLTIYSPEEIQMLCAAADALCFVLGHKNQNLSVVLKKLTAELEKRGYFFEPKSTHIN